MAIEKYEEAKVKGLRLWGTRASRWKGATANLYQESGSLASRIRLNPTTHWCIHLSLLLPRMNASFFFFFFVKHFEFVFFLFLFWGGGCWEFYWAALLFFSRTRVIFFFFVSFSIRRKRRFPIRSTALCHGHIYWETHTHKKQMFGFCFFQTTRHFTHGVYHQTGKENNKLSIFYFCFCQWPNKVISVLVYTNRLAKWTRPIAHDIDSSRDLWTIANCWPRVM